MMAYAREGVRSGMRKLALGVVVVALVATPEFAAAKILDLYLQLDPVGLSTGRRLAGSNLAGDRTDFFYRNEGGVTGFKLGVDVLFLEAIVDFKQGFSLGGWQSAWIGFLAGLKGTFDLGETTVGYVAADVGFGVGTEGPFNPPVNDANVAQKGVVAVGRLGVDRQLNSVISVGIELDVGYHYLFLGGAAVSGATDTELQGVHVTGLVDLKLTLGI
jgi:hypothetical protein